MKFGKESCSTHLFGRFPQQNRNQDRSSVRCSTHLFGRFPQRKQKNKRRTLCCSTHLFGRFPQQWEGDKRSRHQLFHPPFWQISTAKVTNTKELLYAVPPTFLADFHSEIIWFGIGVIAVPPTFLADFHSGRLVDVDKVTSCSTHLFGRFPQLFLPYNEVGIRCSTHLFGRFPQPC